MATLGTCSICGGPVTVPDVWCGIIPPTPTCAHCGAIAAESYGPTIPMRPAPVERRFGDAGTTQDLRLGNEYKDPRTRRR